MLSCNVRCLISASKKTPAKDTTQLPRTNCVYVLQPDKDKHLINFTDVNGNLK